MHAATKPSSLGRAARLRRRGGRLLDEGGDRATLLLVGAFQLLTAPVAAHMVGRAAYGAGAGAVGTFVVDELRDAPLPDPED